MICTLCPRMCRAQRDETHGEGYCGMGTRAVVARAAPHYWEEACLSGTRGCGTIFFSGCPLGCVYCQNYEISHEKQGRPVTDEELAELIANLAAQGVHNISFVTGTHFVPAILRALDIARPALPIVWNTGGYERVETLRALEGKVQVYLPDLKYYHADAAGRYSAAPDYFPYASAAIREMLRQTGPAQIDENGLMVRGTMVRHLILPGRTQESMEILRWIRENLPGAWVSLMAQYVPAGDANGVDQLGRQLTQQEYDRVADCLMELGLEDGFVQELSSSDEKYIPNFDLTGVLDEWN